MTTNTSNTQIRHDWCLTEIVQLFELPLNDLLFLAQSIHRQNFDPNALQISRLLSIKTGACPEDCKYCAQSGHNQTELEKEKLLEVASVIEAARKAKAEGASRLCMGAAWRCPMHTDLPDVLEMAREVKALGMETCMTLGMLTLEQAHQLGSEGLDYYNHNLDTSEAYYDQIVTTRTYQDRLDTLQHVRDSGMKLYSGGSRGVGDSREARAGLLMQLANLPEHPESVPINMLIKIAGTPLADEEDLDSFEFVRTVAVARIMMPRSWVRLSAGRESMNDQMQALCYFAGANSVFCGDKLLTTGNTTVSADKSLFERLGLNTVVTQAPTEELHRDMAVLAELKRSAENELFFNAME